MDQPKSILIGRIALIALIWIFHGLGYSQAGDTVYLSDLAYRSYTGSGNQYTGMGSNPGLDYVIIEGTDSTPGSKTPLTFGNTTYKKGLALAPRSSCCNGILDYNINNLYARLETWVGISDNVTLDQFEWGLVNRTTGEILAWMGGR